MVALIFRFLFSLFNHLVSVYTFYPSEASTNGGIDFFLF